MPHIRARSCARIRDAGLPEPAVLLLQAQMFLWTSFPFSSTWDLIPNQREQFLPRLALLLFYFGLRSERAFAVRAKLPLQMFSDARGQTRCARGIERRRALAAVTIPAEQICDRSDPGLRPRHRGRCREECGGGNGERRGN